MQTEVTYDIEVDIYHPEVIKGVIKQLRDEECFPGVPCPYTPENVISEILSKIGSITDKNVLVLFTLEMALALRLAGCPTVTVATQVECGLTRELASDMDCEYLFLSEVDMEKDDIVGKFDVVMGNPPYQSKEEGNRKSQAVWPYYVESGLRLLKENGKFAMIHPSGWRGVGKSFRGIKEVMRKLDFEWLSMHDENSGQKVFGGFTRYDVYVARKSSTPNEVTEIRDEKGNVVKLNIKGMEFIPNFDVDLLSGLIAQAGEERVEILYSQSLYETRKAWMSKEKVEDFQFPCVRYVHKGTKEIDCWYSNEDKGHFGEPKVMFGTMAGAGAVTVDYDGEYGLTQFVAGIVDEPKNLKWIKNAMNSEKFQNAMKSVQFTRQEFNLNVIRTFRKNFWEAFV